MSTTAMFVVISAIIQHSHVSRRPQQPAQRGDPGSLRSPDGAYGDADPRAGFRARKARVESEAYDGGLAAAELLDGAGHERIALGTCSQWLQVRGENGIIEPHCIAFAACFAKLRAADRIEPGAGNTHLHVRREAGFFRGFELNAGLPQCDAAELLQVLDPDRRRAALPD